MSQIRRRMAETMNLEPRDTKHERRVTSDMRRNYPLHLSRTLYKSTTFYAKQTQFQKGPNERKLTKNNEL